MVKWITFFGTINEKIIFASRWLLLPFDYGLIVALIYYMLRFVVEDYFFITHAFKLDMDEVLVQILGLVDIYMVANLIIMVTKGSFQIFIHKFDVTTDKRPQWLDHIDSGLLKVKIAQSIASITAIALLKDFFNTALTWQERVVLHLVVLTSAVVFAIIWRITHPKEPQHEAH